VLNLVHDLAAKGAALTAFEPTFSTKDAAEPSLIVAEAPLRCQILSARKSAL
jgi:hypothetical protein